MVSRVKYYRQLHEASELLWEKLSMLSPRQRALFDERLLISWIYHDFALEGTVLSVAEIKAAIDDAIISSSALIPAYDHVVAMSEAVEYVRESRGKPITYNLEWLKKLHILLLPSADKEQTQYRKDNPVHRLYFHDLAPADKISYRMRKLSDTFRDNEALRKTPPFELSAEIHRELLHTFPWPDLSGRVARLAMNNALISEGFWPAIIHTVDRQRYYEVLRQETEQLVEVMVESVEQGLRSANKLYQVIVDSQRSS